MQYDPVKRRLGKWFNQTLWLRLLFYKILDLLLLRSWHIRKELRKWDRERPKSPVQVLDAGFGFGQYSYYLSGLNHQIQLRGLDLKEEQVEDCNQFFSKLGRKNASFFTADLTTFSEKEAYDLVLCVDVMEHIEEDTKVFHNFCNCLKKNGMVLISTPSDQGGSDVHEHGESSFIEEHVRDGYNKEDITAKLKEAGFSRAEVDYSYGKYGKISWRFSMKYPILLTQISKWMLIILPLYYLVVFPFCLILNCLDVRRTNSTGTGLIVKAYK